MAKAHQNTVNIVKLVEETDEPPVEEEKGEPKSSYFKKWSNNTPYAVIFKSNYATEAKEYIKQHDAEGV